MYFFVYFALEEKNLLSPLECFSGVSPEEEDDEFDLVCLCFDPTGDLIVVIDGVSLYGGGLDVLS